MTWRIKKNMTLLNCAQGGLRYIKEDRVDVSELDRREKNKTIFIFINLLTLVNSLGIMIMKILFFRIYYSRLILFIYYCLFMLLLNTGTNKFICK